MVQNSPETPKETINLKTDADVIRKALGIEDVAKLQEWFQLLQTLVTPLNDPEQSAQPEAVKVRLRSMYVKVSPGQGDSLHTKAVQALVDAKSAEGLLPEGEIRRIKRALSLYYETRFQYEELWSGKVGTGRSVPPYLAEFIKLRENEKMAFRVVENLLPIQYDVMEDAGFDPIDNREDKPWFRNADRASQLALLAMGNQLSFEYVLSCLNEDGNLKTEEKPYRDFLLASGVPREQIDADAVRSAKLLIGFLKKYREKVQGMAKLNGVDENKLTINQAIEATADTAMVGRFASEIVNAIEGFNPYLGDKLPDLGDFAKEIFDDAENYPGRVREAALAPLMQLNKENGNPEDSKRDAEEVVKHLFSKEASDINLKNIDRLSGHLSEEQMAIVNALSEEISKKETQNKVLSTLFIDPSADLFGRDKQVADALEDLMGNKQIKAKEAFEIHYLLHGENTVAVAYLAIRLLERHNYKTLAFRMKMHVFEQYSSLAASSADDIDEIAKRLKLTPKQKVELRNMRLYLKDHGVDTVHNLWDKYWAMWQDHPWWMGLFHTPLAIGGTRLGIAAYNRIAWDSITRFVDAKTDTELEAWIQENTGEKIGTDRFNELKAQARAMQVEAKSILDMKISMNHRSAVLRMVGLQTPKPGEILRPRSLRIAGSEIIRAAGSGDLAEIARTLRTSNHVDGNIARVVDIMAPLGNPGQIAEALHDAGYEPDAIKQAITQRSNVSELAGRTVGNVETTLGKAWADVKSVEAELKILDDRSRKPRSKKGGGRRG